MRELPKVLLVFAFCLMVASGAALLMIGRGPSGMVESGPKRSADPLEPDEFAADLSLRPFSLVDQDGRPFTEDVLQGRLTIMDFMFTHCPLVCPMMTGTMAELSDKLKGTDVQFLSVSVDPERDTPEQLKAFASRFGADFSRWRFARGDKDATWSMIREGLLFAIEDDESLPIQLPDGSTMVNIRHPSHFVLVGPTGRVLGLYSSTDPAAVKALEVRAKAGAGALKK